MDAETKSQSSPGRRADAPAVTRRQEQVDVVIVGAGATGGWAAKRLAEAGLQVVVLEAGRAYGPEDHREHTPAHTLPYRGRSRAAVAADRPQQSTTYAFSEYTADWWVRDVDEPYTTPAGQPFPWVGRMRVVGGRTHVWGRQCYRYSDLDFRAASRDGFGIDWPIGYADLAPYYDLVERYVGITGINEGIPQLPDQQLQPPMGFHCVERHVREVIGRTGRTVTQGRTANLTQPTNGRPACHMCGPCERGCATWSYFNAAYTTIPDAEKTGRCRIVTNAMAAQVLMDPQQRRATGIRYIDRVTRSSHEVHGRVVILAAQAFESVRLLLNSASSQDPGGLANSSGVLGKYLLSHFTGFGASAEFPAFARRADANLPRKPTGLFVARFRNLDPTRPDARDFPRGYGYQGGGGTEFVYDAPGFGVDYARAVRESGRTTVNLGGFGEPVPDARNQVTLDPSVVDAWGIPVVKIDMRMTPTDHAMMRDGAEQAAEMLEAAGGTNVRITWAPRWASHEVGIARMGADPKTSVLNQFQQAHDVRNLFVMDGASLPSVGYVNPTLTMMALVVRSCDYVLEQLRQVEI